MNKLHKRRLLFFSFLILGIATAIGMILFSLKQNINVFFTPSDLVLKKSAASFTNAQDLIAKNYHFRLGGMVKMGSVQRIQPSSSEGDLLIQFIVTDFKHEIPVRYKGVLPDLFREGKGVIVNGTLDAQGIFNASEVLAKHDENYMPLKTADDSIKSVQKA